MTENNKNTDRFAEIDYLTESPAKESSSQKSIINWLHYHMLSIAALFLIILVAGIFIRHYTRVEDIPDYRIGIISTIAIPEDTAAALEREIAVYGTDLNNDGQVLVKLNRFVVDLSENEDADLSALAAGKVQLSSDLQDDACSSIFLTIDPKSLEAGTGLLLALDGTLPEGNGVDISENWENLCYAWNDCPVLKGLPLGDYKGYTVLDLEEGSSQEVMSDFYICRRVLEREEQKENNKGSDELWEALTER